MIKIIISNRNMNRYPFQVDLSFIVKCVMSEMNVRGFKQESTIFEDDEYVDSMIGSIQNRLNKYNLKHIYTNRNKFEDISFQSLL